ncbi:unnamed protein product [Lactuca saligna]|uniref:Uncharacterized protein n=1 Tax=Lactuca saligna TaxID=75948 RepID=A0AA36E415_LACSI|nr:unnamed protein product [Lactuca saligna]
MRSMITESSKVLQRIAKTTDMAHLAGMDAITLTKLILDAHTRAAEHSDACEDLFRRVKFVGNLLVELRITNTDKEIPLQEGYCGDKVDDFESPVDDGELNCNVSEEDVRERS